MGDDVDAPAGHASGRSRHGAREDAGDARTTAAEASVRATHDAATAEVADGLRAAHAHSEVAAEPAEPQASPAPGGIASVPEHMARRRSKGIGRRARSIAGRILLDVLAVAGLLCILLVAASFLFKVSIVMFATGSMSPTIPAGSIAFVREVPATEIAVGDVVTVDRSEMQQLPVTHRVIEIVGTDGDVVTFRMQGDDNDEPDIAPYEETTVQVVLWSIPGLANVIVRFQDPFVLGGITIGATVLVTWAFWPRDGRQQATTGAQHAD